MRTTRFLAAGLVLAVGLSAVLGQVRPGQKQRPGDAPRPQREGLPPRLPEGTRLLRDEVYARLDGNRTLKLDLYLPKAEAGAKLPLVIWIHGGGWRGGSKNGTPAVTLLADGFAVASVEYRLSAEAKFPAQINDCKGAVRYLRANADKYGLDANAFGAWGSSAGGHLVAMLGTAGDANEIEGDVGGNTGVSSRVQAVCDWFGPTDLRGIHTAASQSPVSLLLGGTAAEKPDLARQASPVTYVTRDDPPLLIVHGDRDATVPLEQSEKLHEALRKAGAESELVVVKGAGHGQFRDLSVMQKVREFFLRTLQKKKDDPGEQAVPGGSQAR